jgi:hypothetical protein
MNSSVESKTDCTNHCEDQFVRCSSRKPVGCVEELRVCRERCRSGKHDR